MPSFPARLVLAHPHHDFEVIPARAVTVDDLMRLLIKLKPTVLHFAGHGVAGRRAAKVRSARYRDIDIDPPADDRSGILLLDEHGDPQLVTARALAKMVTVTAPSVRLLLLNACYTEAQAEVLSGAADAVITMNGAIRDDSARSFAAAFYRALGYRLPVGVAFSQAKATLAGKGCPDEDLPRLHTRNAACADDIVLTASSGAVPVVPRPLELDTGRIRRLVERQAQRGCVVGLAFALVLIAAAAYVLSILQAGGRANDPQDRAAPTTRSRDADRDRPESARPAIDRQRDPEAQRPAQPTAGTAAQCHAHGEAAAPRHAQPQKPRSMARHPPPDAPPPDATQLDDRGSPGELDRDIVRRYIGFHLDQVRHCYEEQRIARPALAGTVHAQFTIAPQGSVASSVAAGLDGAVASCVAGVIKDIAFPRSGVGVQVSYPFHFHPAGDRDEPDER